MDKAASFYILTLGVTNGLSAPFNNLALIYKQQVIIIFYLDILHALLRSINIWFSILICTKMQGNYSDAISCYTEVLRINPLAADGFLYRGNTFKELGRVNDAIQDYIQAINIRPTMAEAHTNLASAYKDR